MTEKLFTGTLNKIQKKKKKKKKKIQFKGLVCFLYHCKNNLQKNTNKSYRVCKVIVVLFVNYKMFGIR